MTAKEEALKLVERFDEYADFPIGCALVAVDEILKVFLALEENTYTGYYDYEKDYWKEVKQEINKL